MALKDLIVSYGAWFWPCFYSGLGFLLSSLLISVLYFSHSTRMAAVKGLISKPLAEFIVVLLFLPSMSGVIAVVAAIAYARSLTTGDTFILFPATFVLFTGLGWYLNSKDLSALDDKSSDKC
jgi:hypothetical protein